MEDTPSVHQEIEIEAHVSIEMENNNITNQEIGRENNDDDLIQIELQDDPLFNSIKEMLDKLSPRSFQCCIYRVPRRLRKLNEEVYTPQVVSIGPFHHGEECLQNVEEYKLRHLKAFLDRTGRSLGYYLKTVKMWEQEARDCYAETIKLSSDEFIKMILVDGSFIVEFLLREDEGDGIFDKSQMIEYVIYDMILLENQLPFFVLDGFLDSIPDKKSSFLKLVHERFNYFLKLSKLPDEVYSHKIKHFVDLMHCLYLSSIPKVQPKGNPRIECLPWMKKHFINFTSRCHLSSIPKVQPNGNPRIECLPWMTKHFVDFMCRCYRFLFPKVQHKCNAEYEPPPTVTELHQAGIKFKKGKSISLFDITFTNGILEIPQLDIEDITGSWFQNLIAFEQCHDVDNCILSDYFGLLDGLINTSKDVDLLIRDEIIRSMLGSSEEASTLFNHMFKGVLINTKNFHFSTLCQELNAYCKSPRHKWMATLRRDYFSTPWAVVSVIAAVILLVLTLIQAICSIISL